MIEKANSVLSMYDMTVKRTFRGRGATILETDKGYRRLMEYKGTPGRLEFTYKITEYLREEGFRNIDALVKNREGKLFSEDEYEDKYIVTEWFSGNECDVKSETEIMRGITELAKLHKIMKSGFTFIPPENEDEEKNTIGFMIPVSESLADEYIRHNKEMKRTSAYIRSRKKKNSFEYNVIKNIDKYIEYGIEAVNRMSGTVCRQVEAAAKENNEIIHGNYSYHNIIFEKNRIYGKNNIAIVNFDKAMIGTQIKDLYLFLRKVMEKYNWDKMLGHKMLQQYNDNKNISGSEYTLLKTMLEYPEKYWKVINHYYNSNKAWMPEKSGEKLEKIYQQEENKKDFIYSM